MHGIAGARPAYTWMDLSPASSEHLLSDALSVMHSHLLVVPMPRPNALCDTDLHSLLCMADRLHTFRCPIPAL
jgi:hypothetical protein